MRAASSKCVCMCVCVEISSACSVVLYPFGVDLPQKETRRSQTRSNCMRARRAIAGEEEKAGIHMQILPFLTKNISSSLHTLCACLLCVSLQLFLYRVFGREFSIIRDAGVSQSSISKIVTSTCASMQTRKTHTSLLASCGFNLHDETPH